MQTHEPLLQASLASLAPTQITVGRVEVASKRQEWVGLRRKERERALGDHWFPAVKGPKDRHYIVDHHHLGLALREEGVKTVWLLQLADLSAVDGETFWRTMEFHRWAHPFDRSGRRRPYGEIPSKIDDLQDDPYRSLAGVVRGAGGYAKDAEPYAEFLWADFFRERVDRAALRPSGKGTLSGTVVTRAVAMAHGDAARYLPGWSGAA